MEMGMPERTTGIGMPMITQDLFRIFSFNGVLVASSGNAPWSILRIFNDIKPLRNIEFQMGIH
jgi:hypothetical protein